MPSQTIAFSAALCARSQLALGRGALLERTEKDRGVGWYEGASLLFHNCGSLSFLSCAQPERPDRSDPESSQEGLS